MKADSELKLKEQTEELTVRDTTPDAFMLTVVLFCMYICINLLMQT